MCGLSEKAKVRKESLNLVCETTKSKLTIVTEYEQNPVSPLVVHQCTPPLGKSAPPPVR